MRRVTSIAEGARRLAATISKGAPVSNRRQRTAAEEEAQRLRTETANREQHRFGKKKSKAATDESGRYMQEPEPQHFFEHEELNPTVTDQLGSTGSSRTGYSIMEEVNEARVLDRMRPFVEGEPIGKRQKHDRRPAPMLRTRDQIMDERQKALRERQARNDRVLQRMLEKCQ